MPRWQPALAFALTVAMLGYIAHLYATCDGDVVLNGVGFPVCLEGR